ncbi:MAG: hypothetical protein FRX49_05276 [Trebouxia sp. A1-2]|nr:MAG: hypothetical protein FRX49_05276 [Trebouxia sp. A1-2]
MLGLVHTSFSRNAIPAKSAAAAAPAAVPSRLTAPSVPLGTTFSVVIRQAMKMVKLPQQDSTAVEATAELHSPTFQEDLQA